MFEVPPKKPFPLMFNFYRGISLFLSNFNKKPHRDKKFSMPQMKNTFLKIYNSEIIINEINTCGRN